jgi:hypothetical protein
MPVHLADSLAKKYLNGLNQKTVCSVLDLFTANNEGFNAIKEIPTMEHVALNMVYPERVSSLL